MSGWATRSVRISTALAVAATGWAMAANGQAVAATAVARKFHPPKVQRVKVLPRVPLRLRHHHAAPPRVPEGRRRDSVWPSRGSATIDFSAVSRGGLKVAGLPELGRADRLPVLAGAAGPGLAGVRVDVLGRVAAARLGVSGVVFTVSGQGSGTGRASVGLSYAGFANAGGAGWADRLHLAELPACALTTPRLPRCQVQTPIRSVVHSRASLVSATVGLGGAGLPGLPGPGKAVAALEGINKIVLAAVSGASGSNGDFTASSLSPQGTWAESGSGGDFTWSYPINVPKPAAGSAPSVALDYDSSSVDGRVASTNNQFGMVGEGFTLSSDSYIERTYADCADDPEGAISGKYDNCWAGQVVTMNLDGRSTSLVLDDSTKTWHEAIDTGDRVQYQTGTSSDTGNGTYDNGYWVVTTPDGTQYFFGKNKGPGWASGDPVTNSAFTEPVYGAHSGDPCYSSSGFESSSCTQAWRWNLDFVIDPNGNAQTYYYNQETNYYGANNETTGVQYVRGGYLSKIDYGLRYENGSVYGTANAPEEIVFHADQRCIPTSTFDCAASKFNSTNASNWPDTPQDQQCNSGATCNNHDPTFWSQMRIDQITTQYYSGSGYTKVDSYALNQGFSAQGDPELVLNSVTRTGYTASGSSLSLPSVQLAYQLMDNRIPGYNNNPPMQHWRLTSIETETGETIGITYSTACTSSQIPSDASKNTTQCYPVMWTPFGDPGPVLDYFNKYVVSEVQVQDGTAGDPEQVTQYQYIGNPAWHYDDNEVVKAKNRTYGQFRGYPQVNTLVGNTQNVTNGSNDVQTLTETRYFQGMNGDTLPGGGTSSGITVADSNNKTYSDDNALAGQVLETQTFNGSGSAELSAAFTQPSAVQTTATRDRTGLPAQQATMVRTVKDTAYTDLAAGGQQMKTTATTYDNDGRAVLVDLSGTSVPETCTQTTYDDNTSAWMRDAVSEVITAQQSCPSAPGNLTASDVISDKRTYYDGATSLTTPPTDGNQTMTTAAVSNNNGSLTFQTKSTSTYDGLGRVLSTADALGNTTTSSYTPADGGPVTQTQTTNALSQTVTKTFDPGRGNLLSITDAAGYLTTASYDALGRLTAVWKPGRSQANNQSANITYSYQVSQTAPLAVTANALVDYGTGTSYVPSISIYDSLGQLRQTQAGTEGGNTIVSDRFYDSHGWVAGTNNKYVVSGGPSASLVYAAPSAVNDRTLSYFDGTGRVTSQQDYNGLTPTDSQQMIYGGNQTTTISRDASGNVIATPTATVSNVLGQATQTIQYASAPTVSGSVVSGGSPQVTTNSYDASGNKTGVTDPAGNAWSYSYDLLGQQAKAVDPDTGTTTTGYDAAGNITYTTDARGVSNNFTYDKLNRKTAEYTGSTTPGSGTKITTWVWDTLKKGLISYQTSTVNGVTYDSGTLGYDSYGTQTGTWVSVPAGQPLAGTYRTTTTHSSTGLTLATTPAAGGGLPVDSITYKYDQYGNPIYEAGNNVYAYNATWTPYNEISQVQLGTGPSAGALTYSYDPQTRMVTGINLSDLQPSPQADNIAYTYNAARQVTQIADTQGAPGAAVEDQCFSYDSLSRLSQAWTSSNACQTNPATSGNGTVSGPQPYWQSWTFDQLGDILTQTTHAPAGSSAGDTTSSYNYGAAGHAHAVSSITATNTVTGNQPTTSFGYDASGNTTTLGSQSLTWDSHGKLATAGPASYVYDAGGNLLVESDNSGSTLYLPNEQITKTSTSTTGVRYYTFAGRVIAETTPTTLYWLCGNTQGTMSTAVSAFSQSTVIRRASTPYGTVLGGGSGTWPDNRTLMGAPTFAATGLVNIGAREYDPATGLFISADPVLDTGHPQTMTGYTYAADNPVTNSDPSGDMLCMAGGPCGSIQFLEHYSAPRPAPAYNPANAICYYCYAPPRPAPAVSHGGGFNPWSTGCGGYACTATNSWVTGGSAFNIIRPVVQPKWWSVMEHFGNMRAALDRTYPPMTGLDVQGQVGYQMANEENTLRVYSQTNSDLRAAMKPGFAGYGLAVVGAGVAAYGEWNQSNHSWNKTVAVGATDTAIGVGATLAGSLLTDAIVGSAFGTVCPGLGTAVGFAAGLLIGVGAFLVTNYANKAIDDWNGAMSSVGSGVSHAAKAVGNFISNLF